MGIPRSTFYLWYNKYQSGGVDALEDKALMPARVWSRIPDNVREQIIGNQEHREPDINHHLIMLIAKAHEYMDNLTNGTASSINELANQEVGNASRISRHLRLTFLALTSSKESWQEPNLSI